MKDIVYLPGQFSLIVGLLKLYPTTHVRKIIKGMGFDAKQTCAIIKDIKNLVKRRNKYGPNNKKM